MSETTWRRFEIANRRRTQVTMRLRTIREEFRGSFIRNYSEVEGRYLSGDNSTAVYLENVRLTVRDIDAIRMAGGHA